MGEAAERLDRIAPLLDGPAKGGSARRRREEAVGGKPSSRGVRSEWNVLAAELVSYPPLSQRIWLEFDEIGRDGVERAGTPVRRPAPRGAAGGCPRPASLDGHGLVTPRRADRAAEQGTRGLRRLLPGAATLVAMAALWFGLGAFSSSAQPLQVHKLPGSVAVAGGYSYLARQGDTLWSIARRAEPAGDPRPLVDRLQSQLHGRSLVPGDRLLLPR